MMMTMDEMISAGYKQQEIADHFGVSQSTVSRRKTWLREAGMLTSDHVITEPINVPKDLSGWNDTALLTADEVGRITSLDDLITFFKVDTERWQVRDFRVNKWEQGSKTRDGGVRVTPLYQVRANLIRSIEDQAAELERMRADVLADIAAHAPPPGPPPASKFLALHDPGVDPVLATLNVYDPHIGMLAWGKEVGKPYDTDIASGDYAAAVDRLLSVSRLYPVERILYVVGHDLMHADSVGINARGGVTAAGTPQDLDSRLERIRTAVRRVVIAGIDQARTIAPVDVVCVPGNHDKASTYWLGEVLNAWYRNDDLVDVRYSAMKRKFYGYGRNAFMLTHGEEYKRGRDSLPLIFATECPADIWVASEGGLREVLTGHNHVKLEGKYHPTSEASETRAIRTRSLPGLTPEDSWHFEQGYKHHRAATLIAYHKSGNVAGLHEFSL